MSLIDPTRLNPLLGNAAGRFDVDALAETDSTNSEVMRRAEAGAPSGLVVVADEQSAGRGRRGRTWLSAPADSLTFSLLWRFTGPATQLAGLSLAIGVAISDALESLGAKGVSLKWPNDILCSQGDGYAKLAGVLVELSSDSRGTVAVIGIGLNLQAPTGEMLMPAAGLSELLESLPERHALFAALLIALAKVLDRFATGGFAALQADWQHRHAWQDKPVCVLEDGKVQLEGVCRGADTDGALLVNTASGQQRLLAGDVSLRQP